MKIALLGGRFDPPHVGHWWIAKQVLEYRTDIDQLWLVPASQHQWKPIIASGDDRLKMLEEFQEEKIILSDMELTRGGVSYSIDTIKDVKNKTGAQIFWIVGSDILTEYHRWDKTDDLEKNATFLVFPRDPYHLPENLPEGFEAIREPSLITSSISSTNIRTRIQEKKPIHGFVLPQTERYIVNNKLYI